MFQCQMEAK